MNDYKLHDFKVKIIYLNIVYIEWISVQWFIYFYQNNYIKIFEYITLVLFHILFK